MKDKKLSQEEFEGIERYLTDSMSREDRSDFEKSLMEDDSLNQKVKEMRVLFQAVEEQTLRDKLNDFHEESTFERNKVKPIGSYRKYAIAASIALLAGLSIWLTLSQKPKNEKLFAEYFNPDPGLITPMGTTSNYEFFRGMVDYKQTKYKLAIERWNLLVDQKPKNDTLNFYIGIAYLARDESEKAIVYLSKAVNYPNSKFINEAWYYLGLAQLKEGHSEKAIGSFKKSNLKNSKLILMEMD